MNSVELTVARTRKHKSRKDMAEVIGRTGSCYAQKETGKSPFTKAEMVAVAKSLELSISQFNEIFFDGDLDLTKMIAVDPRYCVM